MGALSTESHKPADVGYMPNAGLIGNLIGQPLVRPHPLRSDRWRYAHTVRLGRHLSVVLFGDRIGRGFGAAFKHLRFIAED